MTLPTYITIFDYRIYTFGLFLVLGFLLSAFVVWREGKKDGFDEEKLFDLLLISTVSGIISSKLFYAVVNDFSLSSALWHALRFWAEGFDIVGALLGAMLPLFVLSRFWRWSVYRVLDIFALAWSLGTSVVLLGYVGIQFRYEFIFGFSSWILLYVLLERFRNRNLRSGYVFSIYLLANSFLGFIFFRESRNLIFYFVLVTLSLLVVVFRRKKALMKIRPGLSKDFLNSLKDKLSSKEERLDRQEEILDEEDPYSIAGRDIANAEFQDESEEDRGHLEVEGRRNAIAAMRTQIVKALARMKLGKYGICEVCGEEIDKARLKAYPEATTCVRCAELST